METPRHWTWKKCEVEEAPLKGFQCLLECENQPRNVLTFVSERMYALLYLLGMSAESTHSGFSKLLEKGSRAYHLIARSSDSNFSVQDPTAVHYSRGSSLVVHLMFMEFP